MQALERASWQNPKVLTTLLMVFVLGAFTGALSMRFGLHERLHHAAASSTLRDPHAAKVFLDRCRAELNLTPKQSDEMASILDDYIQYYQSLDDVRATGRTRILQILNPDQQKKFEKLLSEIPK